MDPIPLECRLDMDGLREQRRRYEQVAATVEDVSRTRTELVARLAPAADERLVAELVAVERDCCPFFTIAWDPASRTLSFAVAAGHADALDAIEHGLRIHA